MSQEKLSFIINRIGVTEPEPVFPGTELLLELRKSDLVNINTATAAELETLPGIGASTAAKIIEERETNGPFKTLDDLKRVSGIGDKKFESLEKSICI